jgi:hypothetical protein
MPDGPALAMLLLAGTLACAAAHAVGGWYGVALALAGISIGVLALALWTLLES